MPFHSEASCGSRFAWRVVKSCARTAFATRPDAAASASRSSDPSSACAVQLVAQLSSGASSTADTANTKHPMRIAARILSARRFLPEDSTSDPVSSVHRPLLVYYLEQLVHSPAVDRRCLMRI